MGKGRKPMTAAQQMLEGNRSKKPSLSMDDVVHPDEDPPEPPSWLDEEARKEWDRVIVNLRDKNLVGRSDTAVLGNYCRAVSLTIACHKDIDKHGSVSVSDDKEYKRPVMSVLNEARGAVIRYAGELGLTVVSRTRLGDGRRETKRKSPLKDFVDKGLKIS